MTAPVLLPKDGTWVAITDGTNGAWITGNALVYIGTTAPDATSKGHPMPADGLTVNAPAKAYAKSASSSAGSILVSKW